MLFHFLYLISLPKLCKFDLNKNNMKKLISTQFKWSRIGTWVLLLLYPAFILAMIFFSISWHESLKLAMIAVIVAITMMGAANAGSFSGNDKSMRKVIHLTLQQAVSDLGLVAAISQRSTYFTTISQEPLETRIPAFCSKIIDRT